MLTPQPCERSQLIIEMIGFQEPDHRCGAGGNAAVFLSRGDLITDIRTGRRTEALASPVWPEEQPPVACKDRTECFECLFTKHSGSAPVVVHDRRKWSCSFRLINHSVQREPA